mgnify:FL=1
MLRYTIICLSIAIITGMGLNILSGLIESRQKELAKISEMIDSEVNRINILKAEWAFQTQPAKLQKHAENILMMTNPKENQFIKISEVPLRDSAWKMNRGVSNKQLINTNFAKITFLTN